MHVQCGDKQDVNVSTFLSAWVTQSWAPLVSTTRFSRFRKKARASSPADWQPSSAKALRADMSLGNIVLHFNAARKFYAFGTISVTAFWLDYDRGHSCCVQ